MGSKGPKIAWPNSDRSLIHLGIYTKLRLGNGQVDSKTLKASEWNGGNSVYVIVNFAPFEERNIL
jgi:hypothetical protein